VCNVGESPGAGRMTINRNSRIIKSLLAKCE
jgi:hypothetical protein